jgi:hypothetical protein
MEPFSCIKYVEGTRVDAGIILVPILPSPGSNDESQWLVNYRQA